MKIPSNTWVKLLCTGVPFQTSSYFFKSDIVKKYVDNLPEFISISRIGDVPLMLLFANEGRCLYINQEMSCYRNNSVGSWTSTQKSLNNQVKKCNNCIERMHAFDEFSRNKYTKWIDISVLRSNLKIDIINKGYTACFQKKYRRILCTYTTKQLLSFVVFSIFPFAKSLLYRMRGNK